MSMVSFSSVSSESWQEWEKNEWRAEEKLNPDDFEVGIMEHNKQPAV